MKLCPSRRKRRIRGIPNRSTTVNCQKAYADMTYVHAENSRHERASTDSKGGDGDLHIQGKQGISAGVKHKLGDLLGRLDVRLNSSAVYRTK